MSEIKEVLVYHHSHLDVGYTHVQPILWELQRDYIDQAIDLCEQTEDWPEEVRFRWTCEATAPVLKWLESSSDKQIDRFRRYLQNGQICLTAMPMHTAPLCTAEQLARMLYPVRLLRERFGIALRTAVNHDINGQPWTLSQLLLDAGIELYITGINIHFGGIPLRRPLAFRWRSPDGRDLLAFNGEHYSLLTQICRLWEKNTEVMQRGLDRYLARLRSQGYPYDFVFLSATNVPMLDNTPPDRELPGLMRRWNAEGRGPRMRFATPEMLLERLRRVPAPDIPVCAGDWTDYWNFGAGSAAYETGLSRRTKLSLQCVELLEAFRPDGTEHERKLKAEAWEQTHLYDEHTWGANISVADPDSPITQTQWMHKAHTAYQANSLALFLLARQLERLADNPLQSGKPEGILLVNPTHVVQTVDLRVPDEFAGEDRHTASGRFQVTWMFTDSDWTKPSSGRVTLAPFSWKIIPLASLKPETAAEEDVSVTETETVAVRETLGELRTVRRIRSVESPYYRLTFDEVTGRITGLLDKRSGWQVLDPDSEWTFFQFVRESVDPLRAPPARTVLFPRDVEKCNDTISCWNHDWPAKRTGADRLTGVRTVRHASGVTLELAWEAPGVEELVQRITLFSHRPAIELVAQFRKKDVREPEAIYFAFPLNMDNWTAVFDTAGTFVELDREQLPGVCRDWVTVDRTVSVFNQKGGVTLACPDAPLVMIGGFHFGRENASIDKSGRPLLLAWPVNNYWDTNFRASQPGKLSFRYELTTIDRFDPERAIEFGLTAARPVQLFPVIRCGEEKSGTFLQVRGQGAVPFHVKRAEDGNGVIIRLQNVTERETDVTVGIPGASVQTAYLCSALEENLEPLPVSDGEAKLRLYPRRWVTLRIVAENQ